MTVANQELPRLYRGTDVPFEFTAPSPPPGGCADWTVQLTLIDASGVKTQINGTVTDPTAGVLSFTALRATTLAFAVGKMEFEVARTDTGSNEELANGSFPVWSTLRDP